MRPVHPVWYWTQQESRGLQRKVGRRHCELHPDAIASGVVVRVGIGAFHLGDFDVVHSVAGDVPVKVEGQGGGVARVSANVDIHCNDTCTAYIVVHTTYYSTVCNTVVALIFAYFDLS